MTFWCEILKTSTGGGTGINHFETSRVSCTKTPGGTAFLSTINISSIIDIQLENRFMLLNVDSGHCGSKKQGVNVSNPCPDQMSDVRRTQTSPIVSSGNVLRPLEEGVGGGLSEGRPVRGPWEHVREGCLGVSEGSGRLETRFQKGVLYRGDFRVLGKSRAVR